VFEASTGPEIDSAFEAIIRQKSGTIWVYQPRSNRGPRDKGRCSRWRATSDPGTLDTAWRGTRAESVTSCPATLKSSEPSETDGTITSTSGNNQSAYPHCRGANSDLLPADLAREMVRRNPPANVREIEGCSTRNPLMSPDQIRYVSDFLTCDAPLA
jgi:hypothetical protein